MTKPPGGKPEALVHLASKTDVGQVRAANEDSCDVFTREDGAHLLVVADGMGGHRGGATASSNAVATIAENFIEPTAGSFTVGDTSPPAEMLKVAIQRANARVYEMAQQDPALEGMGTTVVAFFLRAGFQATVAHVGDSRAYRLRGDTLEPITTDHSVVAEMQRRGLLTEEEAAVHPRRNEILRSVGVLPDVEVEVSEVEVKPGDRFVLCSDGLSGVVSDPEIAAIVGAESPESAVDALIQLANERGGPDNITAQILSIPADAVVQGDPEATADVEISTFGIEQIEAKRRQRSRTRQAAVIAGLMAVGFFAYYMLQKMDRNALQTAPPDTAAPVPQELPPPGRDSTAAPKPAGESESAPQPQGAEAVPEQDAESAAPNAPGRPSAETLSDGSAEAAREARQIADEESTGATRAVKKSALPDRYKVDRVTPRRGIPRPEVQP